MKQSSFRIATQQVSTLYVCTNGNIRGGASDDGFGCGAGSSPPVERISTFIGFNTTLDVTRRDGTIDTRLDIFKRCQHR